MALRISESVKIGGIRIRLSAPVTGKGRVWGSVGTRTGRGWTSVSAPLGGKKRRR